MPRYEFEVPDEVYIRLVQLLKSHGVACGRNALPAHIHKIAADAVAQFVAEGGKPYWIPTRTYDQKKIDEYNRLCLIVKTAQEAHDSIKKSNGFTTALEKSIAEMNSKAYLTQVKTNRSNWLSKNRMFSVTMMGDLCKPVKVADGRKRRRGTRKPDVSTDGTPTGL